MCDIYIVQWKDKTIIQKTLVWFRNESKFIDVRTILLNSIFKCRRCDRYFNVIDKAVEIKGMCWRNVSDLYSESPDHKYLFESRINQLKKRFANCKIPKISTLMTWLLIIFWIGLVLVIMGIMETKYIDLDYFP